MIEFRQMRLNEIDEVVKVAVNAFGENCRQNALDDFKHSFDGNKYSPYTLVAVFELRIVGAVQIVYGYLDPGTYILSWLCVSPDRQREGIGADLIRYSIQFTRKEILGGQLGTLYLSADFRSDFYERFGFVAGPKNHHGADIMLKIID